MMESYFLCLNTPPVPKFVNNKFNYSQVSKFEFYRIINFLSKYYTVHKIVESGNRLIYNCVMVDTNGRSCGLWEIGYKELSDVD